MVTVQTTPLSTEPPTPVEGEEAEEVVEEAEEKEGKGEGEQAQEDEGEGEQADEEEGEGAGEAATDEVEAYDSRPASQVFLSPQRPPLPTETSCKHQGRKGWKCKGGAEDRGEGSECRKGVLAWVLGALFGGHW
jgi:hypothetical protein